VSNPFVGVSGTPVAMTNAVGTAEGMVGKSFFVGTNGDTTDPFNNLCSAKPFTASFQLGTAQGICPEAPSLNGTYLMAGLAHTATCAQTPGARAVGV
jgi:type IV pilus assembly protein PilY1